MQFKIAITQLIDNIEKLVSEQLFDQDIVNIGRGNNSDIYLNDSRRVVGRLHAVIKRSDKLLYLHDQESQNGTFLNDIRVSSAGVEIKHNDLIKIGHFLLFVNYIEEPFDHWVDPAIDIDINVDLDREDTCLNPLPDSPEPTVGQEEMPLLPEEAPISKSSQDIGPVDEPYVQDESFKPDDSATPEEKLPRNPAVNQNNPAFRYANTLLEKFASGSGNEIKTDEDLEIFFEHIEMLLNQLLGGLTNSLKGRKAFEHQFDTETTKIFSWKHNRIKQLETLDQLSGYIFGDLSKEHSEAVELEMKEALGDLSFHPIGIMAGASECFEKLLESFSPELLEDMVKEKKERGGLGLKRFGKGVFWEEFKLKYNKLTDNKTKTFETFFGPAMAKGYLSVQKKKK